LAYLDDCHWQPDTQQYAWTLRHHRVSDGRGMAYGHAFVLLARAAAVLAGLDSQRDAVEAAWQGLERLYWEPEHAAYADERSPDGQRLQPYRGQNANMHVCEACLLAYEATAERKYFDRARLLVDRFAFQLAGPLGIWEHYNAAWEPDWDYNRGDRSNIFKPWGFQTGVRRRGNRARVPR
jgi:mannose/cellobiose epimerase-like protein (N-acyl-D-glucosamine 2-epimerase family)